MRTARHAIAALAVVALATGLLGLTFAVVGAALFVKGALARFLRFWMARLIYEQQAQADRLAAARGNGDGRYPVG